MANKKRRQSLSADYRHVLLGMTLEEIERMDEATKKILREKKAQKSAKASRPRWQRQQGVGISCMMRSHGRPALNRKSIASRR
jgi:hypothetical protein